MLVKLNKDSKRQRVLLSLSYERTLRSEAHLVPLISFPLLHLMDFS